MRVIEAENDICIKIIKYEEDDDEWFVAETHVDDGNSKKMIKLIG